MTTDTYTISTSGKATITKDPQAVLDYSWDWAAWLAAVSDTISSISIAADTGLSVASSAFVGGVVTAWLSGGTAGTTYRVVCHITTAGGRQDERSVFIKVVER